MDDAHEKMQGKIFSEVDENWYREKYPDVAEAGMPPAHHYLQYGRQEGRFPRPLQALILEQALWGGFSHRALPGLRHLYESTPDPEEKSYAAWALARWYTGDQAWSDALPFLHTLQGQLPRFLEHPGTVLLSVEVLLRNGRVQEAWLWLRSAMAKALSCSDFLLAAANARLPREEEYTNTDDVRLAWLNCMWRNKGLAPVGKKNQSKPLTLNNLQSFCDPLSSPKKAAKVSVLMPAFNASNWIETALQSLLNQTWTNFEVIIVDDASSDNTAALVKSWASFDSRVILLQQRENQGAYVARNLALQYAKGDFITNHDSDDWSHSERLERMVQPLLDDTSLIATMADWVRVDGNLHFQTWRAERSIVEASVATLMCRKNVLQYLGGWDNVRIAADYELYKRLQCAYGIHSVHRVMPGTPLVLARQLPGSLTAAPDTHLRTMYFGVRSLYQELFETWHKLARGPHDLVLPRGKHLRAFPAPAVMLCKNVESRIFDCVIMADLSATASGYEKTRELVESGVAAGLKMAVFHWPEFKKIARTADYYLTHALKSKLEIISPSDSVSTSDLCIVNGALLACPPESLPKVKFKFCKVASLSSGDADRIVFEEEDEKGSVKKYALPLNPSEFNVAWYLHRYPDVRKSRMDPWQHYIKHGAAEGREPGPNFNTPHYLRQCNAAFENRVPALVHYLHVGKALGYDPTHPVIHGAQAYRKGAPTLLLCAHAAGEELLGAERCFLDVVEACQTLHINVLVSIPSVVNSRYVHALQNKSHKVFCVPTTIWQAEVGTCPHATVRLIEIIRSEAVDIVQANTITLREPMLAAQQAGSHALLHIHEVPHQDPELCRTIGLDAESIRRTIIKSPFRLMANSMFTANYYGGKDTAIVKNAVDLDLFNIENTIQHSHIVVGLISSNHPKKGLKDFLRLSEKLESMDASLELRLIGPENSYTAAIHRMKTENRLPSNVVVAGYADTPLLAVSQCNVIINLSRCQETFGRTVLEAMAARRPVVIYRQGSLPELVTDKVNGFILDTGDILGVAQRLCLLAKETDLIRKMGEAGRQMAKKYSIDSLSASLNSVYRKTLKREIDDDLKID